MDTSNRCSARVNSKMRKPLVEKKRRARINESLHELRVLMADTEIQSKMENAEVLEMTVKRVESILQSQDQEADAVNREACERFAAGYIQCMHDVHTFVSSSPWIDPTVAAELLNHLLESMPLHGQDRIRVTLTDALLPPGLPSPGLVSPAPSCISSDDLCSDLDDTDSEQSQISSSEEVELHDAALNYSKSVWRPW
ncbi:transcription cofactor HES-6 [Dunckerocampus dactyliophorus]|uniref:transcription cofactor HES-6 n=1 Tax=Dunckerocampus dactyliophorus TaxID=161453 RepID=UPI002406A73C|nr:transcription cofactor HES-6 [Dunckerocampus dactyliophorus]